MFFAYDPRRWRLTVLVCALLCAAMTTLSLLSRDALSEARGGLSAGLMFAFLYVFSRLRARSGWGVGVEDSGVSISRPLSREPISVRWVQVLSIHRAGRRRDVLVLALKAGGRVLIPRHLFASTERFEDVVKAIDDRLPRAHDA